MIALWRRVAAGVRALARPSAADRDVADEVDAYLEEAAAAHVARGLAPDEALRAARLELGGTTRVREDVRGYGWENVVETAIADLRHGARRLRRSPGFAAVSLLTLAVGIGASTAIFSAVKAILLEALPYPGADRIMTISDVGEQGAPLDVTFGTYRELAQRCRSFEAVAVFKRWLPAMTGDAEPDRLSGQRVSAAYFRSLGAAPVLGRDFLPAEDRVRGPRVVVLSEGFWQRRFAGDRAVVGRTLRLDDGDYRVVGVMGRGFENVLAPSAELWAPLQYAEVFGPETREWGHHLRMVARRRSGVSPDAARRELAAIARTPVPQFPRVSWASMRDGFLVTSLQSDVIRSVRPALFAVIGAVSLVLLIACVNVTNLLLARGAQRRGEFAMRVALGAGRVRLVRQLLTESLLLALIGGALGMAVAAIGVRAFVALSPPTLPRVGAIRIDAAVFAFGAVVAAGIGVLVGVLPALHSSREDPQGGIRDVSPHSAGRHGAARGALVVAEIALALVLLVSAGLLMRSVEHALAVPVGFDGAHLLTQQIQEPARLSDAEVRRRLDAIIPAVESVPGVAAAAFTSQLPLSGDLDGYGVRFESDPDPRGVGSALRYAVTSRYFAAMRIPLRRGRLLDAHDGTDAPHVALLNESVARRVFGGRDPLGRRLRLGPDGGPWYTVVGVVGDVKQTALAPEPPDAVYLTPDQSPWSDNPMSLVVRARGDAAALSSAVRRAIRSVDPDAPIVRVATMDTLVERSLADRRFALTLFEAFGLVALLLAAIGIYGVLAGSVAERAREIGVRSAMGASRARILGLVYRKGMALTGVGVVAGVAGASIATRAIATLLFGVSPLDPTTYLGVAAVLASVAGIACGVPAWRAARVDPAITLRAE